MDIRIIVAGGRDFFDYELVCAKLDKVLEKQQGKVEIVSGGAKGADTLGERYAREHGIDLTVMPAQWEKYGKSAGPRRNAQMAEYASLADEGILIAFWDGTSRGTANMIKTAKNYKLSTEIIRY